MVTPESVTVYKPGNTVDVIVNVTLPAVEIWVE
jgi:hypothetical protein